MGRQVAQEVHTAPLPGRVQDPRDGRFQAFMGVGDHQFDTGQAAPGMRTQERRPKGAGVRTADRRTQYLSQDGIGLLLDVGLAGSVSQSVNVPVVASGCLSILLTEFRLGFLLLFG